MNWRYPFLLAAPAATLLVGLLACPVVLLVRVSLCEPARGRGFFIPGTWTLANYWDHLQGFTLQLIGYTVAFACAVTLVTVPISFLLAYFLRSLSPSWQRVGLACVLLPKFASILVVLFGLQQILGLASGIVSEPAEARLLIRGSVGAVLGEVYLILPYAVLFLFLQMRGIDPALLNAARGLGASPWQTFCRITLPLTNPGLILTGQLSMMWGMGAFLGPLLLGGPDQITLSVEIHRQAFEYGRWPRAASLAVLLMISVAAVLLVYSQLTRLGTASCVAHSEHTLR